MTVEIPRRALVVGLARSGQAAALALAREGAKVVATDRNSGLEVGRLETAGVEVHLGNEEGALLSAVDVVIKSPGVPGENPLVQEARERALPVWSEVELGYRLLRPRPFLGVTGTKGKTTTVELLGEMFRAAGRAVAVGGNVGRPLTSLDPPEDAWIVAELSSFQLEDVHELELEVAVLLNLEADHLDRHGSVEAYRAAKLRIFERARQRIVPRGLGLEGIEFASDDDLPAEPRIPGEHNASQCSGGRGGGTGRRSRRGRDRRGTSDFRGVPHRLELIRERDGVRWVNDSIATNTFAVRHGIDAYDGPVRLILGGRAKGEDFVPFARALPGHVAALYLVGEAADELAAALDAAGRPYERVGTIGAAVEAAARDAQRGDVVLLSPACASYDQYASFEERGDDFRRLVEAL